jgi:nucleoid-associated protein YgaU
MKGFLPLGGVAAVSFMLALSACSTQEDMAPKPAPKPAAPAPAPEAKAPAEKAKATKIAGDVGLLDTEKNYMIIVTKEGKLVTVDFDANAQAIQRTPHPAKVSDIGLGSSATVQYTKQGDKNVATSIEYVPAKGE